MGTVVLASCVHNTNLYGAYTRPVSERPNFSQVIVGHNDIPVINNACTTTDPTESVTANQDASPVQVDQLSNMHPKKSPAEAADDHHTVKIPDNVLVLQPMAKESEDICIPLDRQKEVELIQSGTTVTHSEHLSLDLSSNSDIVRQKQDQTSEAKRPSDGDVTWGAPSDEDAKTNDQLAKLFPICLSMGTISIAIVTAVLVQLLLTKVTDLLHPVVFKSMAWSGLLSFISSATACGLSYIRPPIRYLIRFIEMSLILGFSLILITLVIAFLIL